METKIENNMDNIIYIKDQFDYIQKHTKESYVKTWTETCKQYYMLTSNKDEFDTVKCFELNIELIAEKRFDEILERQIENPIDITDKDRILDYTKK